MILTGTIQWAFRKASLRAFAFIVLLTPLLWHPASYADDPDPKILVKTALEKLDATDLDDDWSFTMEVVEGEELRIVHSDPRRGKYDRRQLLSINGEKPGDKRLQAFRAAEEERIDDIDPETTGYGYLVDIETLQLMEQGDDYLKLSFAPRIKAMEKSREHLRGSMLLNTRSQQIEEIEIHNIETLSPAFSVTVNTYRLALTFAQEQEDVLINTLQSHAVGKAGFLKHFDALVDITFSDYKRAVP